jgi:GMP synthase-like glutamine amidotransferase
MREPLDDRPDRLAAGRRPAAEDRDDLLDRNQPLGLLGKRGPVGLAVCDPWPEQVYQWHREGFDLPQGSELLAEGDSFPVQAFRNGNAYALQFHPDVTHATICLSTTRGHDRTLLPGAKPRAAHFADRAVYDPAGRAAEAF